MAGLLLVVVWLYTPTLAFGFFWDDPLWFGRIVGKSLGELIQPTPDYQFYRPGVMLYYRLFMRNDNTFAAPLLPNLCHPGVWRYRSESMTGLQASVCQPQRRKASRCPETHSSSAICRSTNPSRIIEHDSCHWRDRLSRSQSRPVAG